MHKAGYAYSSGRLIDVHMTNVRKKPCGEWMIVLYMVMSFIIGCVDRMYISHFFQRVSLFSNIVFCLVALVDCLPFLACGR